ncbi:hypothetical protein TcWFU_000263 [Taenia crassiceps]|uniref:C2 domain-containing protein n=1 Tax=Taenia crassiceps TaxID=6207 RepID=A0ABR4Q4N7_9CEST
MVIEFQDSLTFSTPMRPRSKSALLEVQIWAKWLPKKDSSPRATAFDTLGVPAPRFLGFLQLPLLELLRTAKSTDLPEAFHWACLRQDTSWEPTSSYDRFPVYPLFQPSVDNLNDNWIALSIGSSVPTTSEDDELMREFKVPRCAATTGHAALSWYSNAQANKGMPALCDTVAVAPSPTKVESFPAYVHLERANRLASDATRLDWTGVETFASFVVTDENRVETGAQRVVVTPLASNRVSPVWNYRRFVRLPLALVTTESKMFTVDFWQKSQGETHPYHLGTATMQLFTLILPRASSTNATTSKENPSVGLEFVRGWYEILDDQGTSRGQVLMGVYPLAENEENPRSRRLCSRVEALLNPGNAVEFQEMPIDTALIHHSKSPQFDSVPALTVSPPSSEINASPSMPSRELTGSTEVEQGQLTASKSSLLTTLQSRLEELDIQNARFKQKLLELSCKPRELLTPVGKFGHADRPGKGSRMPRVSSDPPQNQKKQDVPPLSPCRSQHSSSADNFLLLGTGDNNSRIRTASSASSITSEPDSSDGMVVDEEDEDDDDEAEVLLLEGDSIDECEEIDEDNANDAEIQPHFPHNDVSERNDLAVRQEEKCTELRRLSVSRASVSKSRRKEAYNDDRTSIASVAVSSSSSSSTATIASLGALLLRKHVSETLGSEAISKTTRKEGTDCPSTWSASSTDVEDYLQRFRQDLMDKSKPPTIVPSQRKLIISEEEAETLTSLQSHACVARTISTRSADQRETEADAESAEYDEPTGVGGLLDDDSASESATISLQIPRRFLPNCVADAPWRDANAPVPHCHLQALKLAREAAESVRLQKPTSVNSPSHLLSQEFIEDPIRQRIHANLSCLVRKTISTTGDRLQRSEATAAAILKSASQDDSVPASTSSSSATSVQLSSRSLARAARIFEMKL